jgi:hypothetical protein
VKGCAGRQSDNEVTFMDHWTSVFVPTAICMGITAGVSLEFSSPRTPVPAALASL